MLICFPSRLPSADEWVSERLPVTVVDIVREFWMWTKRLE